MEANDYFPDSSKSKGIPQSSSLNAFTLISSVMKTGESPKFLSDRLDHLYNISSGISVLCYCIYVGIAS